MNKIKELIIKLKKMSLRDWLITTAVVLMIVGVFMFLFGENTTGLVIMSVTALMLIFQKIMIAGAIIIIVVFKWGLQEFSKMSLKTKCFISCAILMTIGALILKYQMDDHFYRGTFYSDRSGYRKIKGNVSPIMLDISAFLTPLAGTIFILSIRKKKIKIMMLTGVFIFGCVVLGYYSAIDVINYYQKYLPSVSWFLE
ncbi:membrane hypothetical protein [Brochothrix thermosphacta]|uniref:hypothetical protein n=1 Tax=Brochothrix thermosphacta TaxID=2756 RepID=UPI000D1029C6|nr:hypothetical protein [Brochothrix thermosphacta]SOC27827.1 membrane hypothetical protein [Brochothrix thermosphacta]